jgi:uncharacterized iron-regulated protein
MSRTRQLLVTLILSMTLTLEAFAAGASIIRISDKQEVSLSQLAAQADRSDLILIGEVHDNKQHHDLQLALIRSLWARKMPLVIGLEMMEADSQQQLDDWTGGRMSEKAFQVVFAANWSVEWQLYRDIFIFARDNRIPMAGLNVPKEIVKKVSRQGYDSLTAEEKKNLPQGTTCNLNNPHTVFLKKSFKDVFTHVTNGKVFTYFCEAQTLRNSGMAMNVTRYLKNHPGKKIVGLTGIWHAVRNAITEQLEQNGSKIASTVILPEIAEVNKANTTASEADYLIVM